MKTSSTKSKRVLRVREMSLRDIGYKIDHMLTSNRFDLEAICSAALSLMKIASENGVNFYLDKDGDFLPLMERYGFRREDLH